MLLGFTFENWKSYRDEAQFTMLAGRERLHRDRISISEPGTIRILPVGVLFGGNASGKSNFFDALKFVKHFISSGPDPKGAIPVSPFQLDDQSHTRPTSFEVKLLAEETIFEVSFSVTKKRVISEKLVRVGKASEKTLYVREGAKLTHIDDTIRTDIDSLTKQAEQDNQLLLTSSSLCGNEMLKSVFEWFRDQLVLIAPDSPSGLSQVPIRASVSTPKIVSDLISRLDLGICEIQFEKVDIERLGWPTSLVKSAESLLSNADYCALVRDDLGEYSSHFHVARANGELNFYAWRPMHEHEDGYGRKFEMAQESAGTRQLLKLLALMHPLYTPGSKAVCVIDQLDRSAHPMLTHELIEDYLEGCDHSSRTQMILTAHDISIMNQNLIRRDEMWLTERRSYGSSHLFSIHDYKRTRADKDIQKIYVSGRFGGTPDLFFHTYDLKKVGQFSETTST